MAEKVSFPVSSDGKKPRDSNQPLRDRVNAKLCDGDISGAVRILSNSEAIAPSDDETYNVLRAKHQLASPHTTSPDRPATVDGDQPPAVSVDEIKAVLSSFRSSSAVGVDDVVSTTHKRHGGTS